MVSAPSTSQIPEAMYVRPYGVSAIFSARHFNKRSVPEYQAVGPSLADCDLFQIRMAGYPGHQAQGVRQRRAFVLKEFSRMHCFPLLGHRTWSAVLEDTVL